MRTLVVGIVAVMSWSLLLTSQTLVERDKVALAAQYLDPRSGDHAISCQVTPIQPAPDFAFHLEAGYHYRVPLDQYSGPMHAWVVLTQVTPLGGHVAPTYLADFVKVPESPGKDYEWTGRGMFLLGEGRYQLKWLLLDDGARVCRMKWELDTRRRKEGRGVPSLMAADSVSDREMHDLRRASPATGEPAKARISVLLDAAPLTPGQSARSELRMRDRAVLLGALSALLESVPAASVRLVAFNLEQQRVLYRRDGFRLESLGEVEQTMKVLQLAKVDIQVVQRPTGHLDLVAGLINSELQAEPAADAVIVLGPRERYRDAVPAERVNRPNGSGPHFLFLRLRPRLPRDRARPYFPPGGFPARAGRGRRPPPLAPPDAGPVSAVIWPDTVSLAVHELAGKTIDIETPSDLAKAIQEVRARVGTAAAER